MSNSKKMLNPIPLTIEDRLEVKQSVKSLKERLKNLSVLNKEDRKKISFIGDVKKAFCHELIKDMQDYPDIATPNATAEEMKVQIEEYEECLSYLNEINQIKSKLEVALKLKGAGILEECSRVYKTIKFRYLDGEMETVYVRLYTKYHKRPPRKKKSTASAEKSPTPAASASTTATTTDSATSTESTPQTTPNPSTKEDPK